MATSPLLVTNNESVSRYEAIIDGEVAGFTVYELRPDAVVFTHTEVDSRWEGKGVARALAAGALDQAVAAGKTIVPECPFIASFIRRHPEYLEHVDPAHRAEVTQQA